MHAPRGPLLGRVLALVRVRVVLVLALAQAPVLPRAQVRAADGPGFTHQALLTLRDPCY